MKRTLLFRTRTITSLVVLLMTLPVWGNDGDTFTEETVEGVMLTYTIISEAEKTCMVGEKYHWPVPANLNHQVTSPFQKQQTDMLLSILKPMLSGMQPSPVLSFQTA